MNKKIKTEIVIGIILLAAFIPGFFIWKIFNQNNFNIKPINFVQPPTVAPIKNDNLNQEDILTDAQKMEKKLLNYHSPYMTIRKKIGVTYEDVLNLNLDASDIVLWKDFIFYTEQAENEAKIKSYSLKTGEKKDIYSISFDNDDWTKNKPYVIAQLKIEGDNLGFCTGGPGVDGNYYLVNLTTMSHPRFQTKLPGFNRDVYTCQETSVDKKIERINEFNLPDEYELAV